ncbi:hypothetical protein CEP51_016397 [Fusarium floridanum]|uniref:Hydrophobin n=1 Tax=Fusarium floridanum TaxID=1325733 RepID=A0A428NQZ1_9HYPO|nr:hypothetical protein CEP51_016397 [Fusarium floridanum]
MKPVALFVLPVLVLAVATPQVEERQLLGLSGLTITLNTTCILEITGVIDCAPAINSSVPITPMSALVGCSGDVVLDVLECILKELPVKN